MSLDYRTDEDSEIKEEPQPRFKPPFPYYSFALVVCICAVALIQFYVDRRGGFLPVLLGGRLSTELIGFDKQAFMNGQYWRILTGAAAHGGLIHLGFNAYALYRLGQLFEMLSARAHLALVFLLSAIGGGILSLIFYPDSSSVGASGGIVGFLGYLAVYGWRRRQIIAPAFLKNMLFNIALMVVMGLSINASNNGIVAVDNYGHFGGLITGAVYGLIQIPSDVYKDPREVSSFTDTAGLIALGIFIAVSLFAIFVMLRG